MANAKKLPSGAWRTLATKVINGKTVRKSFTVKPKSSSSTDSRQAKLQSEALARDWQMSANDLDGMGLTVKEAFESYIRDRERVLSPSTIRGYWPIFEAFEPLWNIYAFDIETPQIQRLVNAWSIDLKTKTIRNRVTILLAVLDYAGNDRRFKIRYPQGNSPKVKTPDIEDLKLLIESADGVMLPIIDLAANGGLRRGEIAGLRGADVSRDMCLISVNGDMVLGPDGWVYKPFPKTGDSVRTIEVPRYIMDSIPQKDNPKEFIFDLTPAAMSDRVYRLSKRLGLHFTLHSLRHFSASYRTDIGVPEKYNREQHGWTEDSKVMQRVYDNTMDSSRRKYTRLANDFYEENFGPERLRRSE